MFAITSGKFQTILKYTVLCQSEVRGSLALNDRKCSEVRDTSFIATVEAKDGREVKHLESVGLIEIHHL